MGTRIELHCFGAGDPAALAHARAAIEAVDDALTIHRPSPVLALNAALVAGEAAQVDDPILRDVLTAMQTLWSATEALFDPTVDAETGRCAGVWPALDFDPHTGRVAAAHPLALDFGGLGKGYALDRACTVLRAGGFASALLSAGESSIAVIGTHPLGGGWPLAVPHPLHPGETLVTLEVEDSALSISATVGQGAAAPQRSPIVRPADGAVVTAAATAIAVEPTGAAAEAMSTALLVAPDSVAARLTAARPQHRFHFPHAPQFPAG